MDRQMDGWMDGWMDGYIHKYIQCLVIVIISGCQKCYDLPQYAKHWSKHNVANMLQA